MSDSIVACCLSSRTPRASYLLGCAAWHLLRSTPRNRFILGVVNGQLRGRSALGTFLPTLDLLQCCQDELQAEKPEVEVKKLEVMMVEAGLKTARQEVQGAALSACPD